MLQQVTAEVQPRLAAQVNTEASLDSTCVYGEYHILSSLLLLLLILYDRAYLTPVVEEVSGPSDICQVVLTAILPSGVLQQLFECLPQSLPDITH